MIPIVPPKPKKKVKKEQSGQSAKIKAAIDKQIEKIKLQGINIGRTALIAGGVAFAGYILFDILKGKSKNGKKAVFKIDSNNLPEKKKTKDSWIVASIKGYILAFLIGIAREKLVEALAEIKKDDEAKQDIS